MDYLNIRKDLEVNRDFKNQNNSKYRLANEYLEVSLKLNSVFISSRSLGGSEVLMFQSLLDLCRQSLVMATLQRPSISYALLRQATEKYRDLKCILEQPDLGDLYMRGRNAAPKGIWRKTFRFSKDDDAILHLYNIASDWGVHSTISLFDEAASVETIGDENYVRLSKKNLVKMRLYIQLWVYRRFS